MNWKDIVLLIWAALFCLVGGFLVGCGVTFIVMLGISFKPVFCTFAGVIIWWAGHEMNCKVRDKLKKYDERG